MEAVIMAGGKGSRLKPFTLTLPKPLMPVGEQPILAIVIKQLKKAGVRKITIAVNHMSDLIMAFFGKGDKFGLEIAYSREDRALGTVAPVKLVKDLPDNFLVMNGDILSDISYKDFYDSHVASGALLSIATYNRETKIDFGVLDLTEGKDLLIGFREKPTFNFDVSMGIYAFNRNLLEHIPDDEPFGLDDLVLSMLQKRLAIHAYAFNGYWLDIGRPDDYEKANEDFINLPDCET